MAIELGITDAEEESPDDLSMANVDATEMTCPEMTLNIGIFFDGTFANQTNVVEGFKLRAAGQLPTGGRDMNYSNVATLNWHYKDEKYNRYADCGTVEEAFAQYYVAGIGMNSGEDDSNYGGATGSAQLGFVAAWRTLLRLPGSLYVLTKRGAACELYILTYSAGPAAQLRRDIMPIT